MTVDAHVQLPNTTAYPWTTVDGYYTPGDLHAVTTAATVVVQSAPSAEETAVLLAMAEVGHVDAVVGWADLEAGAEVPDHPKLVGLRHQVEHEPDPQWLLRPSVLTSLQELGERGLTYDLSVHVRSRPAALAVARKCDRVRFVLDHAGHPDIAQGEWEPWASWLTDLAECPNVTCKLSGLPTRDPALTTPYATHVLTTFGADRVMFGSNWPACELEGGYRRAHALIEAVLTGASPTERTAVLGETARRVYGM